MRLIPKDDQKVSILILWRMVFVEKTQGIPLFLKICNFIFWRHLELLWPYVDTFGPRIGSFEATLEPLMAVSGLLKAILEVFESSWRSL